MTTGQVRLKRSLKKKTALFVIIVLSTIQNLAAGSLSASWSPVSDSRVAGYKIKYGTQSGSYSQSVDVGNSTNYVVPNLTEGTTYFFRVAAYDLNRVEGTPSVEVSAVVLKASNIGVSSITSNSGMVAWQTNKPATGLVEFGTTTAYGSRTGSTSTFAVSAQQFLLNLSPSTLYHFRVRSQDQGGGTFVSGDFTFSTAAATISSKCDLNADGSTDSTDLQIVINALLSGSYSSQYDMNKDGKINAGDLQMLTNVVLGKKSCPL
jgi:hypothetical protein